MPLALMVVVLTPAPARAVTKTWTGVISTNWMQAGNWAEHVAPMTGDDLVFPANPVRRFTNNDFPDGMMFNSITISDSGYTLTSLSGSSVTIAFSPTGITADYATGSSTINFPVSGNGTNVTVTNTGAMLVFGGGLNNAASLHKIGTGTAVLLAPGTVGGTWNVDAGILNVRHGAALGTTFIGIQPNATLQVQGGITLPNLIDMGGLVPPTRRAPWRA